jgi:CcmD family protein
VSELAGLFVALMAVWVGVGVYLWSLSVRQKRIERRLQELESEFGRRAH